MMTRPTSLTHEQVIEYIHQPPGALEEWQRALFDAHLENCASCRAYAGQVVALAPRLSQAMQARWDTHGASHSVLLPSVGKPGKIQTRIRRNLMYKKFFELAGTAISMVLLLLAVVAAIQWGLPAAARPTSTATPESTKMLEPSATPEPTMPPALPSPGLIAYGGIDGLNLINFDGQQQFNLPQAHEPLWSPEGQRIAFQASIYPEGEGPASFEDLGVKFPYSELWVMNADGSEMIQLTHSQPDEEWWDMAWSPNGTWLAAVHATFEYIDQAGQQGVRRPPADIYLIRTDGSGQQIPLPVETHIDATPLWSPDGRYLIFINRASELVAFDVNDLSARVLATGAIWDTNRTLAWSPEGKTLAYFWTDSSFQATRVELRLLNAAALQGGDGAEQTLLTIEHDPQSLLILNVGELAWSPDGSRLSFISTDSGKAMLSVVNADGSGLAALAEIEKPMTEGVPEGSQYGIWQSHWTPNWSPDGQWLVYAALFSGEKNIPIYRLDVGAALRGEAQPVLLGSGMSPQWQPVSGNLIPSIEIPTPAAPISSIPVTEISPTIVPTERTAFTQTMATFPNAIAWGQAIAFASYAGERSEIAVLDSSSGQFFRLASANDASLTTPTWSPDGSRLAFSAQSTRYGEEDMANIYTVDRDGANLTLLTPEQPFSLFWEVPFLAWSPDSSWLALVSAPPGKLTHNPDGSITREMEGGQRLYLLKTDRSGERRLLDESLTWASVAWSPDGKTLAYVDSRSELALVSVADGQKVNLGLPVNGWAERGLLAWSPDGSQIAYFSHRAGGDRYALKRFAVGPVTQGQPVEETTLWEWRKETGLSQAESIYSFGDLSWSPDGTRLLFVSTMNGETRLHWINADGSGFADLAELDDSPEDMPGNVVFWNRSWRPSWSPDGRWIIYTGLDGGVYKLDVQQILAGQIAPTRLAQAGNAPDWQPGSVP
ncbi:MAG: hypothetical protein ACOYYS_19595 [Chloroflexota bacterium]